MQRRNLLKAAAAGLIIGQSKSAFAQATSAKPSTESRPLGERLKHAAETPVMQTKLLDEPIIIQRVRLLKHRDIFFVEVVGDNGQTGLALTNRKLINGVWPLFLIRIAPFFEGKDARQLEQLIGGVFKHKLNYKWQGLALWVCIAWLEFAILDLIGKSTSLPVSRLLGKPIRRDTGIYYANGDRKSSAEAVVEQLLELRSRSGAGALKFKLGARMGYTEASTKRDQKLIPMAREALGNDTRLFTDANSSYDVPMALRIGRQLEEYNYDFFEEPVQFDHFEETRAVARALNIPIAGGEQETSMRRFRWLIENNALQIIQPDLLFFGGLTRSIKVARMAAAGGLTTVPHISGYGLGYLYVLHYAAVVPNTLEYQEYKGDKDGLPYVVTGTGKPLQLKDGRISIPTGPGMGVEYDPDYLKKFEVARV